MKRWKKVESHHREEMYELIFSHHGDDERNIACLFRDYNGDWCATSDLLGLFLSFVDDCDKTADEAKLTVEEMMRDHYLDEMNFYKEILMEFEESESENEEKEK